MESGNKKGPLVIAINGPIGIGKTWLGIQIAPLIAAVTGDWPSFMRFADPLQRESMRDADWYGHYDDFKVHVFPDGLTGRQKMIKRATEAREIDPLHWCKAMAAMYPAWHYENQVVINDTLGFANEQEWLHHNTRLTITIVIAPASISIGQQFEGDSRFCLSPEPHGFRAYDSNRALEAFKIRLANALPYSESIDQRARHHWFGALVGESMGQPAGA
jgi:hypothetical protein